jgi:16S rRNA (cytidine1402-2'-O)-methyltransferase
VAGTLFLVGTPIGNLGDLAPRAVETLSSVDVIAAEDTRRTGRLLATLGIEHGQLVSFFEGNETERTRSLLDRLREGASVALVTDGGMPSVSDPGYRLVRACADGGVDVRVVPGPSAALAALVISGLPTDRFSFEGFLPRSRGDRIRRLQGLADDPRTVVLFEAPGRLRALLRDLLEAVGDRPVAVARELTKLHEEVLRGTVSTVLAEIETRGAVRGEVVVVVGGRTDPGGVDLEAMTERARALVAGGLRPRAAAREAAAGTASTNEIYARLVDPAR